MKTLIRLLLSFTLNTALAGLAFAIVPAEATDPATDGVAEPPKEKGDDHHDDEGHDHDDHHHDEDHEHHDHDEDQDHDHPKKKGDEHP